VDATALAVASFTIRQVSDEDVSRVSVQVVAASLSAVAHILTDAVEREEYPFAARIPDEQVREVQSPWNDLFGGW